MAYRGGRSVVLVAGPLELTADQVRAGLMRRATMQPPYFALQKLNPSTQRLVFPPKAAYQAAARDLLVVEEGPVDDPALWAQHLGCRTSAKDLVQWWYRDGYVACVFSHLIADGRSGTRSFAEVLRLAAGEAVTIPTARSTFPVARSALRTYTRNPKALSAVVDIVRPRAGDPATESAPSTGRQVTADSPPVIRNIVMQPEVTRALDEWGAQQQPKVRLPAILVAAFAGALRAEGLPIAQHSPYVVWDIRRYGDIKELEPTNLIGGVALAVDDPSSAHQVAAAIAHHTANATPLAGAFCESVFGWRDRRADQRAGGPPSTRQEPFDVPAEVMPSLSVMTDSMLGDLPWAGDEGQRRYVTFINSCLPGVLPLFAVRIGDYVHLTVVCRADAIDSAIVDRAATNLATRPLELLT